LFLNSKKGQLRRKGRNRALPTHEERGRKKWSGIFDEKSVRISKETKLERKNQSRQRDLDGKQKSGSKPNSPQEKN